MAKLPLATFEKILKESGNNIRVSKRAAEAFIAVIADISHSIALDSRELAEHANRRTILQQDINLAKKKWLEK